MPLRVLVVDDDANIRELLAEYLRGRGAEVDTADTVATGLALLARLPLDAVITDLRLPDADGHEIVVAAMRLDPPVPVVATTGYGTLETAIATLRSGARDLLLKPFRLRDLYTSVETVITRSRAERHQEAALRLLEAAVLASPEEAVALVPRLALLLAALPDTPVRVWREGTELRTDPDPAPHAARPYLAAVATALAPR